MKLAKNLLLWAFILAGTLGCQDPSTESSNPPKNNAEQKAEKRPEKEPPKEFLIDVRSQSEWDSGHLEQAILIPHTDIEKRIGEVTKDKSAKLVLYCRSGGRAGRAKDALEKMGYTNVENGGGYEDLKSRDEKKAAPTSK